MFMPKRMIFGRMSGDGQNGADRFWCVIYAIFAGISGSSERPLVFFRNPSLYPIEKYGRSVFALMGSNLQTTTKMILYI